MRTDCLRRWTLAGVAALAIQTGTPASAQSFAGVDAVIQSAAARRVYPGAAVIIGRRDTARYARGYGHLTWNASSPVPTPDSTIWDLASLTKVLGPASVAARFVDRGLLSVDASASQWIPCLRGGDRERITVRMLLDHSSGIAAYMRVGEDGSGTAGAVTQICAERLRSTPGMVVRYSDLNAILLGALLEKIGGARLDDLVRREVAEPLGLNSLRYGVAEGVRLLAAPTSRSPGFIVRGAVNDWNAVRLNGIAGQAGLFATASDVARFARVWLREGELDGVRWLSPETVRLFLTRSPLTDGRMLGWDVATPDARHPSAYGKRASASLYGHLGWTGTMLWMDPANDLFLVFLTNRAYEPRGRRSLDRMREVRTAVSDSTSAAGLRCGTVSLSRC